MKSARALLPAALLVLTPALAACGDGDDADLANDTTTSSSTPVDRTSDGAGDASESATESSMTDSSSAAAVPPACDLVKKLDIATAYGVTPDEGVDGGAGCAFVAKDFLTATVAVTGGCSAMTGDAVDVKGADEATWAVSSEKPLNALLTACAGTTSVSINLSFNQGYQHEGDPQAQTIGLAELILGRLR